LSFKGSGQHALTRGLAGFSPGQWSTEALECDPVCDDPRNMKLLTALFVNPKLQEFAKDLAETIARRYPPALDKDPSKRPSVNRMTRIIEDACTQVVQFQADHRLGWVGKARLGNAFRWELTELGYRKDFVEVATEAVIVHLSRKKGKDGGAA
jgi:hypothetical protein